MPRAEQPSSPAEELAARRGWQGPVLASGVLTADIADFCQSGISVILGTSDAAGRPLAGRALACRIDETGRVRILLRRAAQQPLLDAVGGGAALAVTFSRPVNHRAIQLKAASATVIAPAASDAALAEAQTAAFRAELVEVGYTAAFATIYTAFDRHDLAAIEFVPEQAFVQTPGPAAGSQLQA
jgi:hypothetical protein